MCVIGDVDGDNPWNNERPLNTMPAEEVNSLHL